jgi:uncharacterized membrane protein
MNKQNRLESTPLLSVIKQDWYLLLLILASLLAGLWLYPQLPDQMPSHWNIHGEVDGWSSKSFAVWFFPLLNAGIYLMMILLPKVDPRKANYDRFAGAYSVVRSLLILFLTVIYGVTLLAGLGYALKVDTIIKFSVSLLILVFGNYMGKFKHNYFIGIRTPWTLASEEVWRRTHRMAGPLWAGAGLLGMLLSFIQSTWAAIVLFGSYMIIAFIPLVYSYLVFRQLERS